MGKGWDGHKITPPAENDALTVRDGYPQQAKTSDPDKTALVSSLLKDGIFSFYCKFGRQPQN